MKISCQNCSSKYTVSDEKVQGKTVKLKCKKCGATILVNAGGATTVAGGAGVTDHVSSNSDAASMDGTSYLVNVAEGDQRTMTVSDLVAAYQQQIVTADTYVWADGMGDWQPLGQVEAIVSALSGGPTPAAPAVAPSAPPPAAQPMAGVESASSAASMAASASRAAATRQGGSKRADVFGNEKQDDIATSAPLFSASARAAASNAAAAARPSQQREENSVLFSLSALTSKSATATPAPSPSRAKDSREDSGLIDLRALAAAAAPAPGAAAASPSVSPIAADDAGLFPLGVPAHAPAAPPVATPVVQQPPASKAPMFIGIGALVAALAIVGVFFATKGSDEKPVTDATNTTASVAATQPPPAETASAAPTTEASAAPTASASASATASASAVAAAPKGGPYKGPTKSGGSTSTSNNSSSTSTKTGGGTTTPPKSKCNCAPTDLMCNMKCSAGGK